ncbi:MAG: hypothetical protein R3C28_09525 [Pirellulaceae bacterium]
MMRFYQQQHQFYCGIDLHANCMHACIVDQNGKKHLHKNFNTKRPRLFLAELRPYSQQDLIVGCESTFNWDWLADLFDEESPPPGGRNIFAGVR